MTSKSQWPKIASVLSVLGGAIMKVLDSVGTIDTIRAVLDDGTNYWVLRLLAVILAWPPLGNLLLGVGVIALLALLVSERKPLQQLPKPNDDRSFEARLAERDELDKRALLAQLSDGPKETKAEPLLGRILAAGNAPMETPIGREDWNRLGEQFKALDVDRIDATWQKSSVSGETWDLRGGPISRKDFAVLSRQAGTMLLKSPKLQLSDNVLAHTDPAWRWYQFLKEHDGFRFRGEGTSTDNGVPVESLIFGEVEDARKVSIRACIECADSGDVTRG